MNTGAILLENVTKYYGPHLGVAGLDLEVSRGEVFGYLGPNGAGKTTTIRMLLDFIRPTSGKSSVLGLVLLSHVRIKGHLEPEGLPR